MPNSYFICLVDVFFSRRIHSIQLRNKSRYIDWNWMENSVHEHFGVHFYVHLHIIHSQTNHWRRNNKKTSRNEYEKWSEWEPECWVHARQSHSRTHTMNLAIVNHSIHCVIYRYFFSFAAHTAKLLHLYFGHAKLPCTHCITFSVTNVPWNGIFLLFSIANGNVNAEQTADEKNCNSFFDVTRPTTKYEFIYRQ